MIAIIKPVLFIGLKEKLPHSSKSSKADMP